MIRKNKTIFLAMLFLMAIVLPAYGGVLDGKSFSGENGLVGEGPSGEDDIHFSGGKFKSDSCREWGFGAANYTAKTSGDRVFFTADLFSEKYGRITYTGTVDGNAITANYIWYDKNKYENPAQIKWFRGNEK